MLRDQVLYLGHLISAAGVVPNPAKLQVLTNWPKPTTVRKMKLLLGFVNFYSDYVADATKLTAILYYLIASKNKVDPIQLSAESIKSFE